jgi:hypothetical protein
VDFVAAEAEVCGGSNVVGLNLTSAMSCHLATVLRRHLTESQRAMAAAKLANLDRGNPAFKSANLQNSEPSLPTFEPEAPKAVPVSQSEAGRIGGKSRVEATANLQLLAFIRTADRRPSR